MLSNSGESFLLLGSRLETVRKLGTESLSGERYRGMLVLYELVYEVFMIEGSRFSWDHIYKDLFSFRNGPFGFEIIEMLIRPDWLGIV